MSVGLLDLSGLSPRVRGNRGRPRRDGLGTGSIPACAGEPRANRRGSGSAKVYPRVCGGTHCIGINTETQAGLSPRVRGNPILHNRQRSYPRSIPACAGEPLPIPTPASRAAVYPRVCGGTPFCTIDSAVIRGLSPRVRGNRCQYQPQPAAPRSIPACAGEPHRAARQPLCPRVYPRVCGGTPRQVDMM